MGNRLSKIYTRTGDNGTTALSDGSRVSKDDNLIEAIGDVDELNSCLGIVLTTELPNSISQTLTIIQNDLFDLGGELSIPRHQIMTTSHYERLEKSIDELNEKLEPLKEFILPGGHTASAYCHLARAVCRRAERRVVGLENINPTSLQYLNRLSDYLFVAARSINQFHKVDEVMWQSEKLSRSET